MGIKTRKLSKINDSLVEWQSVVVADGSTGLTAVAGRGYFINTTAGAITVTFPASPKIGDTIIINDYATTFATNNVTINFNGNKLEADTTNATLSTNDQTHTFVFTDATQGWKIVNQDTGTGIQPLYISATGGTITTSGNFKIHTFTGDGCFVVSTVGNPAGGGSNVDYLVVAGGGGGGAGEQAGGGGAGGFRVSNSHALPAPTMSPLSNPTGITVTAQTYPITVGGGGAQKCFPVGLGNSGNNSVFSTITSTAGGGGGRGDTPGSANGLDGGSGGGGGSASGCRNGGTGNTPPVSPPQGNNGGTGQPALAPNANYAGGGGGAGAAGGNQGNSPGTSGIGGVGSFISPSFAVSCAGTPGPAPGVRYFSGGGGAGAWGPIPVSPGGAGGGGAGGVQNPSPTFAVAGTANTGGGGGGGGSDPGVAPGGSGVGAAGGKGIVIIRYQFQ